jgi:hypothetical protein
MSLKVEEEGRQGDQDEVLWEGLSQPLLALKVEKGGISLRMQDASENWERQGDKFFWRPPERNIGL